jgi:hypothetical protein
MAPQFCFRTNKKYAYWGLFSIFVLELFLIVNFFEYFPNGWDQTEYAYCVRQNYLPHSPYILYFLLGKAFFFILQDAAKALSTLSSVCAIFSPILLYFIILRLLKFTEQNVALPPSTKTAVLIAPFLLGTNYLFISTQEIYIVQLFFVFLSVLLLVDPEHDRSVLAGAVNGAAIAIHNASLFLLPSMLFLILIKNARKKNPFSVGVMSFCISSAMTVILFYMLIFYLLPRNPDEPQLHFFLSYLRGVSPSIKLSKLTDLSFLANSAWEFLKRLTSQEILESRSPCAKFPSGLTLFHFLMAISGLLVSLRANREFAIFWLLWIIPYLCYEILLGYSPDFGVYIVFVLPSIMCLITIFFVSIARSFPVRGPIAKGVLSAILLILLFPSAKHFMRHWHDLDNAAIKHYSPLILGASAAPETLPADAVIIQPSQLRNDNSWVYYTERRAITRAWNFFFILKDLGPFTPMNEKLSEIVTTKKLTDIISSGKSVYAFESNPLCESSPELLDQRKFKWNIDVVVNLDQIRSRLDICKDVAKHLPRGTFIYYKAQIVEGLHTEPKGIRDKTVPFNANTKP